MRNKKGQFMTGHIPIHKGKSLNLNLGIIKCKECKKEIIKTGGNKLYCVDCRKMKDIEKTRKYKLRNPEKTKELQNRLSGKWAKEHKDIRRIYTETNRKIETKSNCEICGSQENLQKHHWRYDKPLLVNTLCSICHEIQHIKNFQQSKFERGILT